MTAFTWGSTNAPPTESWPFSAVSNGWGHNGPLNRLLSRVTYRNGWRLWVENDVDYQVTASTYSVSQPTRLLHVVAAVTDSNGNHPALTLDHRFAVPPDLQADESRFYHWLADRLIDVERHESREFFKVDGGRFIDPHRDANTRLYA